MFGHPLFEGFGSGSTSVVDFREGEFVVYDEGDYVVPEVFVGFEVDAFAFDRSGVVPLFLGGFGGVPPNAGDDFFRRFDGQCRVPLVLSGSVFVVHSVQSASAA